MKTIHVASHLLELTLKCYSLQGRADPTENPLVDQGNDLILGPKGPAEDNPTWSGLLSQFFATSSFSYGLI